MAIYTNYSKVAKFKFVEINTSIKIEGSKEKVFAALTTPSQIVQWWQASCAIVVAKTNGLFAVRWGDEDDPDYVSAATITTFIPSEILQLSNFVYYAKGWANEETDDLPAEFILKQINDKWVEITIKQTGFPQEKPEFMSQCMKGWQDVLIAIKRLVEN